MPDDGFKSDGPITQVQRQILDLIGGRGGMTLAGNRENFVVLYRRNYRWILKSGDSMSGESIVSEIGPDSAYRAIRARARELMADFGPENADGFADAGVLAFLADWPTSI